MRKRKVRDYSEFTMSLFDLSERAEKNVISLDVDEQSEDIKQNKNAQPVVGTLFALNGRKYRVLYSNEEYSIAEDCELQTTFGVSAQQRLGNDLIIPNIVSASASSDDKSSTAETNLTTHKPKKKRQTSKKKKTGSLFDLLDVVQPAESQPTEEETKTITIVSEKTNFVISGEESYKTIGERVSDNIEAIKLLKELEKESRHASPKEQSILNQYTGWGGLQDVFDESKNNVHYKELRELLSPEEYADAARSMLDAFYTPYPVIRSIFKCLQKAGFKGGRVLEPSCGTGRFFGLMPKEMQEKSNLYAVELDGVTAKLAAELYQNAHIRNCSFESINYGDNVFDLAITNVPYGDTTITDSRYNRYNFKIHDYFISKMIDVVRPGGIIVALTSSYSMDKNNTKAREYWASRAELVGAYRLPDNTFRMSHTSVVADVLIFKKRKETISDVSDVEWIENTTISVNGVDTNINKVYVSHPEFILGEHEVVSGPFGARVTVRNTSQSLSILENTQVEYEYESNLDKMVEVLPEELMDEPDFCYCLYEGDIVYKENGIITHITPKNNTAEQRIRSLVSLRKTTMNLISAQVNKADDYTIASLQRKLNSEYDSFVKKCGYVSSRANSLAFREDAKYPLLCSLEIFNDEGKFERKADIFTKRTIKSMSNPVAENEQDALEISLAEKGCIDFEYMQSLTGLSKEEMINRLQLSGRLFKVPFTDDSYETSETYLSGYVKKKLAEARIAAQKDKSFEVNVTALEAVQPKDIPFNQIYCPIGATWVPVDVYQDFVHEVFDIPTYSNGTHASTVAVVNHQFYISNKEYRNVKNTSSYGTNDAYGLELLEDCLNLISKKIYDYTVDKEGKTHAVVNQEKTQIAQNKQELIRQQWNDWVWTNMERRQRLVKIYNDNMNDLVQPNYDGSKLRFPGISANIELMPHQKNAALRIIRTGNTLLAHVVGAGKTFTMIAAAMERKRLGLSDKPCFAVPNHLVEQWAGEINRLYPFANVLITKKKDFQKQNRKKFCAKIATGNWDAVVMSHSQFSHIPMSIEGQKAELDKEVLEIEDMLSEIDDNYGDYKVRSYTRRQYESRKRDLQKKVEKLMESKRDNTVTFEELGVDLLFLDEAHLFKNLHVLTKLQNVAGLTNAVSQKATDLFMKVHYLNDITNFQGVVFATGTPISNAVCELYVMQKYLQEKDLHAHGIFTFDSWISRFSETENKIEVKPEGTGYRSVTRVSKYHNLPELMNIFKLVADIRVADQLDLDVPERRNHNIAVEPSATQAEIVKSFAERAEKIRNGNVDSSVDNMLCVTNDGRKVAIDQRLYDMALKDDKSSKLNRCIRTVFRIWSITKAEKATQLVFCDMGTPKKNSTDFFDLYNDVKTKLISMGIPESEIAFIHDANTDQKKTVLFEKVNRGEVRVLLGSTEKLGAGTNVQKRLIAIHNIDCPWRPSDLEQRAGRIVRQGNSYKRVHVYTYVTKNTFDTYLYQTVLDKAHFIAQIMSAKTISRDMDDIDSACLNYAEIKALSTGNPAIKQKMELEDLVRKLKVLRANHITQMYDIETSVKQRFPNEINATKAKLYAIEQDIELACANPVDEEHKFSPMKIGNTLFSIEEKKEAAELLLSKLTKEHDIHARRIAEFRGFDILTQYNIQGGYEMVRLYSPVSGYSYDIELGDNALGNIVRLNNAIDSLAKQHEKFCLHLDEVMHNLEVAKAQLNKPFEKEDEYKEATARLRELDAKLSVEGKNGIENII